VRKHVSRFRFSNVIAGRTKSIGNGAFAHKRIRDFKVVLAIETIHAQFFRDEGVGQVMAKSMRDSLLSLWKEGIAAVDGRHSVGAWMEENEFVPSHIAAVGKAAPAMVRGALDHLAMVPPTLVITKHGHCDCEINRDNITQIEASHPVPDRSSLAAGRMLSDFVRSVPEEGALLMLVSGGASSLVEVLRPPHTLSDLDAVNREMLAQSLDIVAMNRRRRELSAIKGGGLLALSEVKQIAVLAISDVPGDDISIIGSGIGDPGKRRSAHVQIAVIASNSVARAAVANAAVQAGYPVVSNAESLHGELDVTASNIARQMIAGPPGIYIFGGEPFLELPENPGKGGRNQALALQVAKLIEGKDEIAFLAAGTDGGDGPGTAAGGFVTGQSWRLAPDGDLAIQRADSGTWLSLASALVETGPTGTNVMDIAVGYKAG
jgi:glycerate 2-kinase